MLKGGKLAASPFLQEGNLIIDEEVNKMDEEWDFEESEEESDEDSDEDDSEDW